MAENKIGKLSDAKPVVFAVASKSKGGGNGPGNIPPKDAQTIIVGEEEVEGEEQEGQDSGEGSQSDVIDEREKSGKEGEGEKGDKEGEGEGEGEGEDSDEDGDGDQKGKGKGKTGKGKPGEEGEGEGEDEEGDDVSDVSDKDVDKIKKQAEELYEKLKNQDPLHQQCGSVHKRTEKQNKEGVDKDIFSEQEKFNRERIQAIIDEAVASGKDHPLKGGSGGRGEGRGGGAPKGELITIPMRKPEFLRKMKQFAESEYEKQYYKKGTDWLYTQAYGDIVFKDRPKVSLPRKSVYILVDVSGSMFGDFDGTGKSLLEHLIGYLPTIAQDFVGEVWWMSSGILVWETGPDKGKEARTPLSYFKGKKGLELTNFYKQVLAAEGAGGGTVFNVEFQALQRIREAEGHNAPIIALTDGEIDQSATEYAWPVGSNNKIKGKLPPNTYMMTDPNGISYLKRYYNEQDHKEGFFSVSKNIQYYDVTEDGKYKALGGKRR